MAFGSPSPSPSPSPSVSQSKDSKRTSNSSEETLLSIPGAIVHLIDGKDSPHLATGTFSLIQLTEDGEVIAVFVKVGDGGQQLSWPLCKDQTTARLGKNRYFFSLKLGEEESKSDRGIDNGNLNYGVTFGGSSSSIGNSQKEMQLSELDTLLQLYTYFSSPSMVVDEGGSERRVVEVEVGQEGETAKIEEERQRSSAYWTALAPNVEEYSGNLAKAIARGSAHIIRGIFWCSHAAVAQLEKGGEYMKTHVKPNAKVTHISPRTMKNLRRVDKLSKMTEKVSKGILSGLVTASGAFTGSIVKSKTGQKFFQSLPGEVALATLDSFRKIFDAMELAGKNVLTSTKSTTSSVVSHRYGEEAGEATKLGLSTASHVFATTWTIMKFRKALAQRRDMSKSSVIKYAGKAVVNIAATSKK